MTEKIKIKWNEEKLKKLYATPLLELIYQAHTIHKSNFAANEVELCTLLNIKTGACPENCAYCPQSGHYDTGVGKEKLLTVEEIVAKAQQAKKHGATRFCMGAAWRSPPQKEFAKLLEIITAVNGLGLETCLTAGMLTEDQAKYLSDANLHFYNHNLDTSPKYYKNIISTHTYEDRLLTLQHIAKTNIKICCGGILGLGENNEDRLALLLQLTLLDKYPESIPLNRLIPIQGTPLEKQPAIDNFDFIRMVAVTRVVMPKSKIRLSAGRTTMSDEMQALCFMAGANSIHFGEKLLITQNPEQQKDLAMLKKLDLKPIIKNHSPC